MRNPSRAVFSFLLSLAVLPASSEALAACRGADFSRVKQENERLVLQIRNTAPRDFWGRRRGRYSRYVPTYMEGHSPRFDEEAIRRIRNVPNCIAAPAAQAAQAQITQAVTDMRQDAAIYKQRYEVYSESYPLFLQAEPNSLIPVIPAVGLFLGERFEARLRDLQQALRVAAWKAREIQDRLSRLQDPNLSDGERRSLVREIRGLIDDAEPWLDKVQELSNGEHSWAKLKEGLNELEAGLIGTSNSKDAIAAGAERIKEMLALKTSFDGDGRPTGGVVKDKEAAPAVGDGAVAANVTGSTERPVERLQEVPPGGAPVDQAAGGAGGAGRLGGQNPADFPATPQKGGREVTLDDGRKGMAYDLGNGQQLFVGEDGLRTWTTPGGSKTEFKNDQGEKLVRVVMPEAPSEQTQDGVTTVTRKVGTVVVDGNNKVIDTLTDTMVSKGVYSGEGAQRKFVEMSVTTTRAGEVTRRMGDADVKIQVDNSESMKRDVDRPGIWKVERSDTSTWEDPGSKKAITEARISQGTLTEEGGQRKYQEDSYTASRKGVTMRKFGDVVLPVEMDESESGKRDPTTGVVSGEVKVSSSWEDPATKARNTQSRVASGRFEGEGDQRRLVEDAFESKFNGAVMQSLRPGEPPVKIEVNETETAKRDPQNPNVMLSARTNTSTWAEPGAEKPFTEKIETEGRYSIGESGERTSYATTSRSLSREGETRRGDLRVHVNETETATLQGDRLVLAGTAKTTWTDPGSNKPMTETVGTQGYYQEDQNGLRLTQQVASRTTNLAGITRGDRGVEVTVNNTQTETWNEGDKKFIVEQNNRSAWRDPATRAPSTESQVIKGSWGEKGELVADSIKTERSGVTVNRGVRVETAWTETQTRGEGGRMNAVRDEKASWQDPATKEAMSQTTATRGYYSTDAQGRESFMPTQIKGATTDGSGKVVARSIAENGYRADIQLDANGNASQVVLGARDSRRSGRTVDLGILERERVLTAQQRQSVEAQLKSGLDLSQNKNATPTIRFGPNNAAQVTYQVAEKPAGDRQPSVIHEVAVTRGPGNRLQLNSASLGTNSGTGFIDRPQALVAMGLMTDNEAARAVELSRNFGLSNQRIQVQTAENGQRAFMAQNQTGTQRYVGRMEGGNWVVDVAMGRQVGGNFVPNQQVIKQMTYTGCEAASGHCAGISETYTNDGGKTATTSRYAWNAGDNRYGLVETNRPPEPGRMARFGTFMNDWATEMGKTTREIPVVGGAMYGAWNLAAVPVSGAKTLIQAGGGVGSFIVGGLMQTTGLVTGQDWILNAGMGTSATGTSLMLNSTKNLVNTTADVFGVKDSNAVKSFNKTIDDSRRDAYNLLTTPGARSATWDAEHADRITTGGSSSLYAHANQVAGQAGGGWKHTMGAISVVGTVAEESAAALMTAKMYGGIGNAAGQSGRLGFAARNFLRFDDIGDWVGRGQMAGEMATQFSQCSGAYECLRTGLGATMMLAAPIANRKFGLENRFDNYTAGKGFKTDGQLLAMNPTPLYAPDGSRVDSNAPASPGAGIVLNPQGQRVDSQAPAPPGVVLNAQGVRVDSRAPRPSGAVLDARGARVDSGAPPPPPPSGALFSPSGARVDSGAPKTDPPAIVRPDGTPARPETPPDSPSQPSLLVAPDGRPARVAAVNPAPSASRSREVFSDPGPRQGVAGGGDGGEIALRPHSVVQERGGPTIEAPRAPDPPAVPPAIQPQPSQRAGGDEGSRVQGANETTQSPGSRTGADEAGPRGVDSGRPDGSSPPASPAGDSSPGPLARLVQTVRSVVSPPSSPAPQAGGPRGARSERAPIAGGADTGASRTAVDSGGDSRSQVQGGRGDSPPRQAGVAPAGLGQKVRGLFSRGAGKGAKPVRPEAGLADRKRGESSPPAVGGGLKGRWSALKEGLAGRLGREPSVHLARGRVEGGMSLADFRRAGGVLSAKDIRAIQAAYRAGGEKGVLPGSRVVVAVGPDGVKRFFLEGDGERRPAGPGAERVAWERRLSEDFAGLRKDLESASKPVPARQVAASDEPEPSASLPRPSARARGDQPRPALEPKPLESRGSDEYSLARGEALSVELSGGAASVKVTRTGDHEVLVENGDQRVTLRFGDEGTRRVHLGREAAPDGQSLVLEGPTVSRDHAEIEVLADGSVRVTDRGSKFGTSVRTEASFPPDRPLWIQRKRGDPPTVLDYQIPPEGLLAIRIYGGQYIRVISEGGGWRIIYGKETFLMNPGQSLPVGRGDEGPGRSMDGKLIVEDDPVTPVVSANHLTLEFGRDGRLRLLEHSTNGSQVSLALRVVSSVEGRQEGVLGRIYATDTAAGGGAEIIRAELPDDIYAAIDQPGYQRLDPASREKTLLDRVYKVFHGEIPYLSKRADDLAEGFNARTIMLEAACLRGAGGVCRNQALATAAALEKLVNEGKLDGKVYYVVGNEHAWVEFVSNRTLGPDGKPKSTVIDVAQEYIGGPEKAFNPGRKDRPDHYQDYQKDALGSLQRHGVNPSGADPKIETPARPVASAPAPPSVASRARSAIDSLISRVTGRGNPASTAPDAEVEARGASATEPAAGQAPLKLSRGIGLPARPAASQPAQGFGARVAEWLGLRGSPPVAEADGRPLVSGAPAARSRAEATVTWEDGRPINPLKPDVKRDRVLSFDGPEGALIRKRGAEASVRHEAEVGRQAEQALNTRAQAPAPGRPVVRAWGGAAEPITRKGRTEWSLTAKKIPGDAQNLREFVQAGGEVDAADRRALRAALDTLVKKGIAPIDANPGNFMVAVDGATGAKTFYIIDFANGRLRSAQGPQAKSDFKRAASGLPAKFDAMLADIDGIPAPVKRSASGPREEAEGRRAAPQEEAVRTQAMRDQLRTHLTADTPRARTFQSRMAKYIAAHGRAAAPDRLSRDAVLEAVRRTAAEAPIKYLDETDFLRLTGGRDGVMACCEPVTNAILVNRKHAGKSVDELSNSLLHEVVHREFRRSIGGRQTEMLGESAAHAIQDMYQRVLKGAPDPAKPQELAGFTRRKRVTEDYGPDELKSLDEKRLIEMGRMSRNQELIRKLRQEVESGDLSAKDRRDKLREIDRLKAGTQELRKRVESIADEMGAREATSRKRIGQIDEELGALNARRARLDGPAHLAERVDIDRRVAELNRWRAGHEQRITEARAAGDGAPPAQEPAPDPAIRRAAAEGRVPKPLRLRGYGELRAMFDGSARGLDEAARIGGDPAIADVTAGLEERGSGLRAVIDAETGRGPRALLIKAGLRGLGSPKLKKALLDYKRNQDHIKQLRLLSTHAEYKDAGADVVEVMTGAEFMRRYGPWETWIDPVEADAPVILYRFRHNPDKPDAFDAVRGYQTLETDAAAKGLDANHLGSWSFPGGRSASRDTYLRPKVAADVTATPNPAKDQASVANNEFRYFDRRALTSPDMPERYAFLSPVGHLLQTAADGTVKTHDGKTVYAPEARFASRLQLFTPTVVKSKLLPGGAANQPFFGELPLVRRVEIAGELPVKGYERAAMDLEREAAGLFRERRVSGSQGPDYARRFEDLRARVAARKSEVLAKGGAEKAPEIGAVFRRLETQVEEVRPLAQTPAPLKRSAPETGLDSSWGGSLKAVFGGARNWLLGDAAPARINPSEMGTGLGWGLPRARGGRAEPPGAVRSLAGASYERMAQGGDGAVYRNGDDLIKIFRPERGASEAHVRELVRINNEELARTPNVNVVDMKPVQLLDGSWGIGMRFVGGESLSQALTRLNPDAGGPVYRPVSKPVGAKLSPNLAEYNRLLGEAEAMVVVVNKRTGGNGRIYEQNTGGVEDMWWNALDQRAELPFGNFKLVDGKLVMVDTVSMEKLVDRMPTAVADPTGWTGAPPAPKLKLSRGADGPPAADDAVQKAERHMRSLFGNTRLDAEQRRQFLQLHMDERGISPTSETGRLLQAHFDPGVAAARGAPVSATDPRFTHLNGTVERMSQDYGVPQSRIRELIGRPKEAGFFERSRDRGTVEKRLSDLILQDRVDTVIAGYPEGRQKQALRTVAETMFTHSGNSWEESHGRHGQAFLYVDFNGEHVRGEPRAGKNPDQGGPTFIVSQSNGRWKIEVYAGGNATARQRSQLIQWLINGGVPREHIERVTFP